ncbi:MAG: ABC transporter substrate-binding protein [Verrucomicrobia bacterium]|nr:ABC transporter substrate-binding protein [Verrucomicrobiota bacterium]
MLPGLLLAALTLAAAPAAEPALLIGLLLPPEESAAASLRQGAELGILHANDLPGPKVGLIVRGRPGQWGDDGAEAARMVLDDGARGLIAPPDGAASHLSLQVAGRTAIPVVSLCGDSSVTGAGIPWMVRLAPKTSDEARTLFGVAAVWRPPPSSQPSPQTNGGARPSPARRYAAVVPDGRAGREIARDLEAAAIAAGCRLEPPLPVATNRSDFTQVVREVLKSKPDSVLLWLDSPGRAGRMVAEFRRSGFKGELAGPGRLRCAEFLQAAAEAAEGFLVPGLVLDPASEDELRRFTRAYRERFRAEPDNAAAQCYDAARLLVHVLRQAGGETAHRAFPLTETLPGATGPLSFDHEGNRRSTLNLLVCRNGNFTLRPAKN